MGCYGIGPSRLVGVITELLADDKGLVWPENIAPAKVYLASLAANSDNNHVREAADELYSKLTSRGVGVLYDDRDDVRARKFADADLLGIPYRVVISDKTIAELQYEVKIANQRRRQNLMNQDTFRSTAGVTGS